MSPKNQASPENTPVGRLVQPDLHQILGYQLAQATITATQVFVREVGERFELRPVEFTILTLIEENPGVSAKQLAQALAVTPPNITMWIERLEARRLIERERNPSDRRAQHIRTTAQGSKTARKAVQLLVEGERATMTGLTSGERAILIELLHKVARGRAR